MTLVDLNIRLTGRPARKDILIPGLANEAGLIMLLVRYFEHICDNCGIGTLRQIRRALKLFLQYSEAVAPKGFGRREVHGREHAKHFLDFRKAIVHGTLNEESFEDATGLRWRPGRIAAANRAVHYLTELFIWADQNGANDAQRFNPIMEAGASADLVARAAYEHRRSQAFLGHTWHGVDLHIPEARYTGQMKETRKAVKPVKRFPDDCFEKLLLSGFTTRSASNLRDILIVILLNKGGLRISEALHIWLTDVVYDQYTGMAHVTIPHPSDGIVPGSWRKKFETRAQCLEAEFSRRPRNKLGSGNTEYLGWKSGAEFIEILWCEPIWGRYFWQLWQAYLRRVQSSLPLACRTHPYAFVVLSGETRGRPLTTAAFRDAHEKAVYRAGLVPSVGTVDLKNLGLTEHGHRHAYGNRAKNIAELSSDLVRDMLNHSSLESQDCYTQQTWSERMKILSGGLAHMHGDDKFAELFAGLEPR